MKRLAHLLLIALLVAPGAATAGRYYSVVNVDADDTLNVRTGVGPGGSLGDTTIVGELPPDATGIEATGRTVEFEGRRWREILHDGDAAWVAARFLEAEDRFPEAPGNVHCGGTEPFWGLTVDGDSAIYSTPEEEQAMSVVSVRRGENRINVWGYQMLSEINASATALLVYNEQCSDGMSDFTYAFEVYLMGIRDDAGPLQGCCSFR